MADAMIIAGLVGAPVLVSYLVEAMRSAPEPRDAPAWAPDIPNRFVTLDGTRLRYIVAGGGPALVLLHTLRTQLDMFQKVIPRLAERFRVYALDYPGHGYSDIPRVDYSAEFFVAAVERFLERLDIEDATLVGESIGGSIALLLAARGNRRVRRVVAINPYDYDAGRGLRRSSLLANVILGASRVPILGGTVMRLRNSVVETRILEGGLYRKESLPPALARELYGVGNRPGFYRAFMSLVRHWPSWEAGRAEYRNIDVPVLLLYGDRDWSRPEEREADRQAIPGAELRVVEHSGHFLSLDAPDELIRAVGEPGVAAALHRGGGITPPPP